MLELLSAAAEAGEHHVEAMAFGLPFLTPGGVVAIAMLCVFAIMLWAGVPRIVAGILDQRIAGIRKQLDDAARLRAEAEALRDKYAKKATEADAEIAALKESAERQAEEIVAKAKQDATNLVARHKQVAEDKIAAAERAAVEELRAKVATASAEAARALIADKHGEKADRELADKIIAGI